MSNETTVNNAKPIKQRRGCLFYVKRGVLGFVIILVVLLVAGAIYQNTASASDLQNYPARGQLYDVNGHQMHIYCVGEGSPTVILEAGGYANSLWWYWIQTQLAEHTRVCAYDRAGFGWSEPASGARDALTMTGELHALLEQAGIEAPLIMVGHSFGAQLVRIYANQYPDEVVGMVFVDSALDLPQFADQREYEDWVASNDILQKMLWGMTQFGLLRLTMPGTFQQWGYPAELTNELGALRSSNQALESDTQERYPYRMELNAALAEAVDFGDLPLAILWAPEGITLPEAEQTRLDNLRNDFAGFSTNRVVRFIEGADHGTILGNEQYAQQVTDAIVDVIAAAQTGDPLTE